ncbi:MAG: hypothetical protein P9M14_12005 [Candidatus Alcyoniella australis]|nr:hypothetical protein [Candidatus Alcyoniella australis]
MSPALNDLDRQFFRAQSKVCSERRIAARPLTVVLSQWAWYCRGNLGNAVSVMPESGLRCVARKPLGWMTKVEIIADIDRLIHKALSDESAVEELQAYAALGSMAKAASFLRKYRDRRMDQNAFNRRVRGNQAKAAAALRVAGYVSYRG